MRCNREAVEKVIENYDQLTRDDISAFLCSMSDSCDWDLLYKESNGTYREVAFESLIVLFDRHFHDYLDVLENNKELDIDYVLMLFRKPAIYDLPHGMVLKKLETLENRTELQESLYQAFKFSIKEGDRLLEESMK